jgi:hypothetical protein
MQKCHWCHERKAEVWVFTKGGSEFICHSCFEHRFRGVHFIKKGEIDEV